MYSGLMVYVYLSKSNLELVVVWNYSIFYRAWFDRVLRKGWRVLYPLLYIPSPTELSPAGYPTELCTCLHVTSFGPTISIKPFSFLLRVSVLLTTFPLKGMPFSFLLRVSY